MKKVKNLAKRLLLRGEALRRWSARRARQLDEAYLGRLKEERRSEPGAVDAPSIVRPGGKLDRILFIGDCMWEQNELFPEVEKICELKSLDLNPILQEADENSLKEAAARAIEGFVAAEKDYEPDLILFYARPALLSDQVFDVIRRRWKAPLLGLNLDDRIEFFPYGILSSGNDDYAGWIRKYDLNLTSSRAAVDWYRARGAAVRHMPQGFRVDDRFVAPPSEEEIDRGFSFVGSRKQEREKVIASLCENGVEVEIFGAGWPAGDWVEDPATVFRHSQINLGIGYATPSAVLTQPKGRDIECPGVGACYLTTYNWELTELFEIGREILCYRNIEELIEIYSHYAQRPEACLRIAQAAHRRCHAEHSWEKRLRTVFREVGFKA